MRQQKGDTAYECRYIMRLSAWRHSEDVRHSQTPFMFSTGRRRADGYSSDKSRAFAERWLGASA